MCRGCEKFIHTNKGDLICKRWKKEVAEIKQCILKNCANVRMCDTTLCDYETAESILEELDPLKSTCMSLSLCNTHYQKLYGILNKPVACASCAEKPRVGQCFIRNCPDPAFITQYLKEHEGFEGTITKDSKVCKNCYVRHKSITKTEELTSESNPNEILSWLKDDKQTFLC